MIREEYGRCLSDLSGADVYYWNNYFDWVSFAFLRRLAERNRLFCCQLDPSVFTPARITRVKDALLLVGYRILSGVPVTLSRLRRMDYLIARFPKERYAVRDVQISVDPAAVKRYERAAVSPPGRSVLLFETPSPVYGPDYERRMLTIVTALISAGWHIFVKGHPRLGYSACLDSVDVNVLPHETPAEFIAVDGFAGVLGVSSTCLCTIAERQAEIPVISLIDMLDFAGSDVQAGFRDYLVGLCPRILFAADKDSLFSLLSPDSDRQRLPRPGHKQQAPYNCHAESLEEPESRSRWLT